MSCVFNPALQTSAKLVLQRFPEIEFTTQSFDFPEIRAVFPQQYYPGQSIHMAPAGIEYDALVLNFIIDSNLDNYVAIAEWIQNSTTEEQNNIFSDGTVVMFNTLKETTRKATFYDLMPVSISKIPYVVAVADPVPLIATATFKYTKYKFS